MHEFPFFLIQKMELLGHSNGSIVTKKAYFGKVTMIVEAQKRTTKTIQNQNLFCLTNYVSKICTTESKD
jgi:hypothetical protein